MTERESAIAVRIGFASKVSVLNPLLSSLSKSSRIISCELQGAAASNFNSTSLKILNVALPIPLFLRLLAENITLPEIGSSVLVELKLLTWPDFSTEAIAFALRR